MICSVTSCLDANCGNLTAEDLFMSEASRHGGVTFLELLLLLFVALKLTGYVTWSWWIVMMPLLVPLAVVVVVLLLAAIVAAIGR